MGYLKKNLRNGAYRVSAQTVGAIALFALAGCTAKKQEPAQAPSATPAAAPDLAAICTPEGVEAVASALSTTRVTVKEIEIDPKLPGGVKYVAAAGDLPAYCQVTASFVTNPDTGKTANLLAAFPANWNGKYLQLGCSGHCGNFAVSDVTKQTITITSQGKPGDALKRGYAAFSTDEGHLGMGAGNWALDDKGEINQDYLDDFFYRAQKVLSGLGKEFTTAFYAQATGAMREISRAYFSGCSGGGRDALVAASYFPEAFDGIIAGSPGANLMGVAFQAAGGALAGIRSPDADVPPALMALIDPIVKTQCDRIDGVEDGLIQNPAACDFRPERDLPKCGVGTPADACFTPAQIQTVGVYLTAVTDEHGAVVQPGFSVSELQAAMRPPAPPADPSADNPWPDETHGAGGLWPLANANLKIFAHRNDPDFHTRSVISHRDGGAGAITNYRTVVPRAEVDKALEAGRLGIGAFPENAGKLIDLNRKLLIWSNASDQLLTPYMMTNYYGQLAVLHGGYEKLQGNVRLFNIPGSIHCSMGGVGPTSFDALGAMEAWVERGEAPNALSASLFPTSPSPYPGMLMVNWDQPALRTMPLCAFPAMARYSGAGDVNAAVNWICPADDRRMLTIGESGRRAGVGTAGD